MTAEHRPTGPDAHAGPSPDPDADPHTTDPDPDPTPAPDPGPDSGAETLAAVRRFNRLVAGRVGVLHDGYLGRGRGYGAARLLWEIGDGGCEVRRLRARLGLDSGYVSRLLRALERDGLVAVVPAADRRVREVRLTGSGRAERAEIDARSDALAASLLAPLDAGRRTRLVAAMAEVERLLTAAAVVLEPADPDEPDAQACLLAYFTELGRRFDTGFDPGRSLLPDAGGLRPPHGVFLVARLHGEAVGCAGLKTPQGAVPEVKRMWVAPHARGLGLGRRFLGALEARAAEHGARALRLDTNRALTSAIALYRACGYREVPAFNDEPYAHHWFEKALTPPGAARPAADDRA